MRRLEVRNVSKEFESRSNIVKALGDITFGVDTGEFVCIVGPSGCGKTTLLRAIAGLDRPSTGSVTLDGKEVLQPPESMAVVFQDYRSSLMPWMTVRKNILLPLRHKKLPAGERRQRIEESAAAVGLSAFLDHYPWQLSGGMQQRVAIARAIAYRPEVLLMDEPFASVDAQTRADLEDLMLKIRDQFGITILLVTHDVDESVYLANRVVVLGNRPSSVVEEVTVDLPTPRDQIETKELAEFSHLRAHVFRLVKNASKANNASQTAA
ncbi:MAG TPA: ABC transporter ATP-binding protein [Microbacteriaceae bacterium]|nr:ABC transporter ATP-binding protein [Microbacteriaceae bacterium]